MGSDLFGAKTQMNYLKVDFMNFITVKIFLLFIFLNSFKGLNAKEDSLIFFQKISSERTIGLKLPLKCRIYTSKDDKRFGEIVDYDEREVFFKYKDYDSSEVNRILAIDSLNRAEKYDLVDSLIQGSAIVQKVPVDSIYKISILSGSDNLQRELGMLGASLLTFGSMAILVIDLSQNVGQSFKRRHLIEAAGVGLGVGTIALLMKRNILMSKWRIIEAP